MFTAIMMMLSTLFLVHAVDKIRERESNSKKRGDNDKKCNPVTARKEISPSNSYQPNIGDIIEANWPNIQKKCMESFRKDMLQWIYPHVPKTYWQIKNETNHNSFLDTSRFYMPSSYKSELNLSDNSSCINHPILNHGSTNNQMNNRHSNNHSTDHRNKKKSNFPEYFD